MSLQNLREDALYALLPEGIISLDEQRLIQAVVGGYQDRVDDLRSYTSKLEFLVTGQGLPEIDGQGNPKDNAVIIQVQSPKGKVYARSLDIRDDTPSSGDPALFAWGTNQLQLDEEHVALSAAYGVDKLRLVDASILSYLAATVGAILYQTAAQDPDNADSDARRLLATWFPRLSYKGTAESFESLGRLLGFDDVRMTPLWQRLSPRVPNDAGDPANNPDFSQVPDYWPKQVRDVFYDPLNLTDGPYFTWQGTMTARKGTNSTDFYTQVVNGFNPFVSVSVVGTSPFDPDSTQSPYVLTGGGPETKAYVNPSGTGLRFEAIAAGSSFNGMALMFADRQNGTYRSLSITERLSALKYRSSYFDLALTMGFDHALQQFGTEVVTTNKDLKADPKLSSFGTALSPFRPWTGGSWTQDLTERDWTTQSNGNVAVYTPGAQAALTDRQYDMSAMAAAGLQVISAMEEVRPATRHIREAQTGFLIQDNATYAPFVSSGTVLHTAGGAGTYWGTLTSFPHPAHATEAGTLLPAFLYAVQFSASNNNAFTVTWSATVGDSYRVQASNDLTHWMDISALILATDTTMTFTVLVGLPATFFRVFNVTGSSAATIISSSFGNSNQALSQERDPFNPSFVRVKSVDLTILGTYDYSNSTWLFTFPTGVGLGVQVDVTANYSITSTEVVRVEPGTNRTYQIRPEDQFDEPAEDMADEYPWRRDLVGGGELVDYNTYYPPSPDVSTEKLGDTVAVFSQTGAQYDVVLDLTSGGLPRFVSQPRSISDYTPGQMAIAYSGTLINLELASQDLTEMDRVMQPGWKMYHFGLVQGVLVIDPVKFFGAHHRDGLAAWFPFDEDSTAALTVSDHSASFNGDFEVSDLTPDARQFDPVRGRFLAAPIGLSLLSVANRNITGQFAGGFWLRIGGDNPVQNTILTVGPAQIDLSGTTVAKLYTADPAGARTLQGTLSLAAGWNYLAWAFDGTDIHFYVWPGPTVVSATISTTLDYTQKIELFSATGFDIQDLRVWDRVKNQSELDLARYHQPNPTAVLYRPAWLQVANNYDRYGVKALPSGFVVPDLLPSGLDTVRQAWVERYDYRGLYEAQSRFKEVGLGGGNTPVPTRYLGVQWDTLTGAGTAAVSTWKGGSPGINAAWLFDSPVPQYMVLQEAGSTPDGITPSYNTSGTSEPWPNPLQATNPNRDRIWVKGDDGFVYEISVARDGSNNYGLLATKLTASGSYQPTGAEVQLTDIGYASQLAVNNSGTVYGKVYSGTVDAPWLFMYGNDETNVSLSGSAAFSAWTNPNGFGSDLGVAALKTNGNISFQSNVQLDPGFYRLEVTSGNVGKVDEAFDGFRTVITVGDLAFEGRLCRGQSGADFTATDTFEFTLTDAIPGSPSSWLLSFDWSNALRDDRRGVARQLRINSFKIVRQKATLYRLRMVNLNPVLDPQGTLAADFPSTPGGWMAAITSWGTVYDYKHESAIYSSNETFTSRQPMSNQLTATTVERREDIILNGSFCLPDPVLPSLPVYGGITIT